MDIAHEYTLSLQWKSGRRGLMHSPELDSDLEVATPPQFPGGVEGVWSPEHLFIASVNSCVMTTFLAIAEFSKFVFTDFSSHATGTLEKIDGKFMISKIILHTTLIVPEGTNLERAERILKKSKDACLISNSIKSEIIFHPDIKVAVTE